MKRLREKNINTPEYFDEQFFQRIVDKENNLRQEKYIELIGETRGRVIELGCGMSYFPKMAEQIGESWGLDFTPKAIRSLRLQFPTVNYVVGNALETPFRDKYFDTVLSGELLEHIEEPQKLIDEMVRIAKKQVILSTPKLEFDDLEHLWEFEEEDLKEMLKKYGHVTTETLESNMFPGRSYIFAKCELSID